MVEERGYGFVVRRYKLVDKMLEKIEAYRPKGIGSIYESNIPDVYLHDREAGCGLVNTTIFTTKEDRVEIVKSLEKELRILEKMSPKLEEILERYKIKL